MRSFEQLRFYELSTKLHDIFNIQHHDRLAQLFGPLTEAQKALDALIKDETVPLATAKPDAVHLLAQVSALFDKYFIDPTNRHVRFPAADETLDAQALILVQLALQAFETSLAADLGRLVVFVAKPSGIYNATDILQQAHRAVPDDMLAHVPQAARDELDMAGRALSFELGTAAALHGLRALELMTAAYYALYAPLPTSRNERNLAIYVRKLLALVDEDGAARRPDQRLVQLLGTLKDQYRNPLIHSDYTCKTGNALTMFGMIVGVITQMAEAIAAVRQVTPAAPATASTPSPRPYQPDEASSDKRRSVISPIKEFDRADEDDAAEELYDLRFSQSA
jgi:hypothetical protein